MNNIHIIDDLLDKEELININTIIVNSSWHSGLQHRRDIMSKDDNTYYKIPLTMNDYINDVIKSKIEKITKKKFSLDRAYAIAHAYCQMGTFHIDNKSPNKYTFCLYLTCCASENINLNEDCGYLYIKMTNNKIMCIEPKENRGVFFPSNYTHAGSSYNKADGLRICIAWKLEEIV
jgi:hypothetical protein